MPHVSRYRLSKKTEAELISSLNLALSHVTDGTDMLAFLSALLSDTEKIMLAKRLALVVMIAEGISDSEISQGLHLSRVTVAKMRYFYEARGNGFKIALKKLDEQKRLDAFKQTLFSLARYSVKSAGGRL